MKIGDKIQGVITGIQPYGAFVDLDNQIRGLIHISEIKTGFVENIHELLSVGQHVLVQVVDYDEYTGKASLSLRTLEEEQQSIPRRHRFTNERNKIGFSPFVKQLPIWIRETKEFLETQKHQGQ